MSQKFKNPVEIDGYVSAEYADLSTTTTHAVNAGEIAWNSVDGTFDIGLLNGVTLQAGQEMYFYGKATGAISNGNAVMFAGVQGDHILIAKADAATINANPEYFMGVATQDFTTNQFGYVTAFGNVRGLNTLGYTLGAVLYYDSTTSTDGLLTETEPTAPNAKIIVAAVVRVHGTQGILMVRPHTMPKIGDLQDVNIEYSLLTSNQGLFWNGLNARFENRSISDVLGYTPANASGTTNYVSKFTGATSLGNSQIFDNGTNVGIGTTSPSGRLDVRSLATTGATNAPTFRAFGFSTNSYFQVNNNASNSATISLTRSDSVEMFSVNGHTGAVGLRASALGTAATQILVTSADPSSTTRTVQTRTPAQILSDIGAQSALTNPITGTGTTNYIAKFTGTTSLGNSQLYDNGTFVGIGTDTSVGNDFLSIFYNSSTGRNQAINIKDTNASANGSIFSVYRKSDDTYLGAISRNGTSDALLVYGNDHLALGSVATERMRITSSGNVGIGTTSPGTKLHVFSNENGNWTSTIQNGSTGGHTIYSGYNNGTSRYGIYIDGGGNNSNSYDLLVGSSKFLVRGDGNVGIGTTSPTFPFGSGLQIQNATAAYLRLTYTGNTGFDLFQSGLDSYIYNRDNGFITFGTNNTERMRITSSGNVGIGTTSPLSIFNVQGSGYFPSKLITLSGAEPTRYSGNIGLNIVGGSQIAMSFGTRSDNIDYNNTLNIYNGNVGIGTTSPSEKLSIKSADAAIKLEGTTNSYLFQIVDSNNRFRIFDNTNNSERITLTSGGNVGIGTTSPGYKLHVNGQVSNISIYASHDIVAYSDQSVKTNIKPIENVIERIQNSRGVVYDRTDCDSINNIGFIAQELEENFPELVVTNEDGTKAVKYQNTVAVLFEAIKEQQKQIEELKQIINGITK
jgi:hypothetical protein